MDMVVMDIMGLAAMDIMEDTGTVRMASTKGLQMINIQRKAINASIRDTLLFLHIIVLHTIILIAFIRRTHYVVYTMEEACTAHTEVPVMEVLGMAIDMEASGVSGLEVTVMVMDLVVTDTVVMVLDSEVLDLEAIDMVGLEVMGTEVMLILFILKAMLSHPIKLRRKLMPNLNKPIVNL